MKHIFCAFIVVLAAGSASAQIDRRPMVTLGLGGGWADAEGLSEGFGDLTAGAALRPLSYAAILADVHFNFVAQEEGGGYYFDDSVDRCRDSQTGRFAKSSLCGGTAMYVSGSASAHLTLPRTPALVGGGFRVGQHTGPFVSAGYAFLTSYPSSGVVRVHAWQNYFLLSAIVTLGSWD